SKRIDRSRRASESQPPESLQLIGGGTWHNPVVQNCGDNSRKHHPIPKGAPECVDLNCPTALSPEPRSSENSVCPTRRFSSSGSPQLERPSHRSISIEKHPQHRECVACGPLPLPIRKATPHERSSDTASIKRPRLVFGLEAGEYLLRRIR